MVSGANVVPKKQHGCGTGPAQAVKRQGQGQRQASTGWQQVQQVQQHRQRQSHQ
jgi:hypothetical protein